MTHSITTLGRALKRHRDTAQQHSVSVSLCLVTHFQFYAVVSLCVVSFCLLSQCRLYSSQFHKKIYAWLFCKVEIGFAQKSFEDFFAQTMDKLKVIVTCE
jgi:hypothetical protein